MRNNPRPRCDHLTSLTFSKNEKHSSLDFLSTFADWACRSADVRKRFDPDVDAPAGRGGGRDAYSKHEHTSQVKTPSHTLAGAFFLVGRGSSSSESTSMPEDLEAVETVLDRAGGGDSASSSSDGAMKPSSSELAADVRRFFSLAA